MRYNLYMHSNFLRIFTMAFTRTFRAGVLIAVFFSLQQLGADTLTDNIHFSFNGSLFYLASDNGRQGADFAPITPSAGFSLAWQFFGPLRLEFTEDIYFTNYEYNAKLGYPMICGQENRSAFVLGFVTGIQLTGIFPVGSKGIALRSYFGPSADIRVVTLAFGLKHPADYTGSIETDVRLQTNAIREYFWSKGRWFLPAAGVGIDFPVNEKFLAGLDFRTWFPVYRLYADKDIPSIDGWRFGIGVRITGRKKTNNGIIDIETFDTVSSD